MSSDAKPRFYPGCPFPHTEWVKDEKRLVDAERENGFVRCGAVNASYMVCKMLEEGSEPDYESCPCLSAEFRNLVAVFRDDIQVTLADLPPGGMSLAEFIAHLSAMR